MNTNETEKPIKELKQNRVTELFLRAIKGESLSAQNLAIEYGVSTLSISRDITALKQFLADHREIIGYAELEYSNADHCYTLQMDHFLSNKELFAITKVLIGSRAFNQHDLLELIKKLKSNTTASDRAKLDTLIQKELYHYSEVGSDCPSVIDHLWKLTDCIERKNTITITYYKMNRIIVTHRIKPVSIMFSEYYFYLIAYKCDTDTPNSPIYFRIDRITNITIHRETYTLTASQDINEGKLRKMSQFMWPGPTRRIVFEFSGPSVQAILDRIPTAKIIDRYQNISVIEANVFGNGIKMFLLSQGSWIKVLSPSDFVEEMKEEIKKMQALY